MDNITISDTNKVLNRMEIDRITKFVELEKKINDLKDGDETILSVEFDGEDLSLGQWQRLAIARAEYKNVEILIFDEPTASLDPLQEMQIMSKFMKISKEKTTVLITHRVGVAKLADKIITMREGKIVEFGSHIDLIKNNGEYCRLYNLQKQWYI